MNYRAFILAFGVWCLVFECFAQSVAPNRRRNFQPVAAAGSSCPDTANYEYATTNSYVTFGAAASTYAGISRFVTNADITICAVSFVITRNDGVQGTDLIAEIRPMTGTWNIDTNVLRAASAAVTTPLSETNWTKFSFTNSYTIPANTEVGIFVRPVNAPSSASFSIHLNTAGLSAIGHRERWNSAGSFQDGSTSQDVAHRLFILPP